MVVRERLRLNRSMILDGEVHHLSRGVAVRPIYHVGTNLWHSNIPRLCGIKFRHTWDWLIEWVNSISIESWEFSQAGFSGERLLAHYHAGGRNVRTNSHTILGNNRRPEDATRLPRDGTGRDALI
jgi:hypothetical protein